MHLQRKLAVVLAAFALVSTPVFAQSNDPLRGAQWGLDRIAAENAWAVSKGAGVVVAVVDTGVDLGHPDLAGNILYSGADFIEPNGTCTGSKKNRICVQDGGQDANGHGTHVAGIIAAVTNNGVGVAGVAPSAKILPVRVLDAEGSGTTDQVAAGIRYAADQGAKVINLSLGFLSGLGEAVSLLGDLDPVHSAIAHAQSKGSVVIIAAGNDSFPLCAEPSASSGVLCVGSTDTNDLRSWFSNGDATMMKNYLVAPGGHAATCAGDIMSTYLRTEASVCASSGYDALAGTSMATPHVAGVAALLAAKGMTSSQIISCILSSADDLGTPGRDPVYGYGRLNAARAVSCTQ